MRQGLAAVAALAMGCGAARTQQMQVPKVVPVPPLKSGIAAKEPTDPPARTVVDHASGLTVHIPAGWQTALKDGEISTFRNDARTAPKSQQVRLTAMMGFNPYPLSTFSGAVFYLSVSPKSSEAACTAQVTEKPEKPLSPRTVNGVTWQRGLDEHGKICTEARDLTYTTLRSGRCVRMDLVVNTFCGGEVSGARDMTDAELANIFHRLEGFAEDVR